MTRRNLITFGVVLIIFVLCLAVVFPVNQGALGKRGLRLGLDLLGGLQIVYQADLSSVAAGDRSSVIEGEMAVLENRINPLGVSEPVVQKLGEDRIKVELPGVNISDEDKDRLSRVALLEFGEQVAPDTTDFKWDNKYGKWKPATGTLNGVETELTSRYFKENTYVDVSQTRGIELVFEWDADGATLSKEINRCWVRTVIPSHRRYRRLLPIEV
jgi:preprotein translocase subunit SecD